MMLSTSGIVVLVVLLIAPWAILACVLLRRRGSSQSGTPTTQADTTPAPKYVPRYVKPDPRPWVDANTTSKPRYVAPEVPPAPRRKLFLSWAAVDRALRAGQVTEEELANCLFCTSAAECGLAQEYNEKRYEELLPHFVQAGKEGRLICPKSTRHYNATTLAEIDVLLERNGLPALFVADTSSTLEQIPMYSCVPRVGDGTVIEALWAAHPLHGNWKEQWGAHTEDGGLDDDSGDDRDGDDDDGSNPYGLPPFMREENEAIMRAYRARHPEDFIPKHRGPEGNGTEGGLQGDEDDDTNAPWRESLKGENGQAEVEGQEAWRASLREDTEEERRG